MCDEPPTNQSLQRRQPRNQLCGTSYADKTTAEVLLQAGRPAPLAVALCTGISHLPMLQSADCVELVKIYSARVNIPCVSCTQPRSRSTPICIYAPMCRGCTPLACPLFGWEEGQSQTDTTLQVITQHACIQGASALLGPAGHGLPSWPSLEGSCLQAVASACAMALDTKQSGELVAGFHEDIQGAPGKAATLPCSWGEEASPWPGPGAAGVPMYCRCV
jgi:hypothetical protein